MRLALETIPAGEAGVRITVARMVALIRHPEPWISGLAHALADPVPSLIDQVGVLHRYVRDRIRNLEDPRGLEWLQSPGVTAGEVRAGDCDDKVVLLAALLRALMIPVRIVLVSVRGPVFHHVYLEASVNGVWVPLDPKVPGAPVGWAHPHPVRLERVMV